MKLLITGATGFLGRNLIADNSFMEALEGANITIVTRNKSVSNLTNLIQGRPIEVIESDLMDMVWSKFNLSEFDFILYLAGCVNYFGGSSMYEDNFVPFKNLINAMPSNYQGKLIFASTLGALDRVKEERDFSPLDESAPYNPTSHYGRAKMDCEILLKSKKFNSTIIRIPWAHGPQMNDSHHIRRLFKLTKNRFPIMWFDWPGKLGLISTENFNRVIINEFRSSQNGCKIINVFDQIVTFGDLFLEIRKSSGLGSRKIPIPAIFIQTLKKLSGVLPFSAICLFQDGLLPSSSDYSWNKDFQPKPEFYLENTNNTFYKKQEFAVIITGASSGLGKELSREFLRQGFSVYGIDKNEKIRNLSTSPLFEGIQLDVSSAEYTEALARIITSNKINNAILVNNAAIISKSNGLDEELESLRKIFEVTFFSPIVGMKQMKQLLRNSIFVNILSSSVYIPLREYSSYGAAKSALSYFCQSVQNKHSELKIINFVPGGMKTPGNKSRGILLSDPSRVARKIVKKTMKQKSGTHFIGLRCILVWILSRWQK